MRWMGTVFVRLELMKNVDEFVRSNVVILMAAFTEPANLPVTHKRSTIGKGFSVKLAQYAASL